MTDDVKPIEEKIKDLNKNLSTFLNEGYNKLRPELGFQMIGQNKLKLDF